MTNTVVYYDSAETGAPTLNNAAGSLDAVLNACLVTGFRSQTLTSLTVSGGVATATLAGHGYTVGRMIDVAGCGAPYTALNARHRIASGASGTFTFPAPGQPDGTVTGTITARRSPLGWARPLSSGNVSIYTRTDVTATTMALRVDDTGTGAADPTWARARMIETYSDINTFTNPAPPAGVFSGAGVFWPKGANSTTPKAWLLIGDSKGFYLFMETSGNSVAGGWNVSGICAFGDLSSFRSGDAYHCMIAGASAGGGMPSTDAFGCVTSIGSVSTTQMTWLARAYNGVGNAVQAGLVGVSNSASQRRFGGQGAAYPSPVDNGMVMHTPCLVAELASAFGNPVRGTARGIADPLVGGWTIGTLATVDRTVLSNLVGTTREYLLVGFNQSGQLGLAAFDITGPWA